MEAPVVILFEPSDEPQALRIARTLEGLGVTCWLEGIEGTSAPTRAQALASCRAVVVVLDNDGGAYGALDAGATWGVPVFVFGHENQSDRARLHPFCERVAAAVSTAKTSLRSAPASRRLLGVGVACGVAISALVFGGVSILQRSVLPIMAANDRIGMTATSTGTDWTLFFRLPVQPVELWYELASSPGYRPTGVLPEASAQGTPPLAKPYVILSADEVRGPTTVRVKFRRPGGPLEGPFEIPFDPQAQLIATARSALEDVAPRWISFAPMNGQVLVYFTALLVYKNAIREIRYGFDGAPLDRTVRLASAPGITSDDEVYRALPPDTRSVSVEVIFRDGTRLPVRSFTPPPAPLPEAPPPAAIPPVTPRPRTSRPLFDPLAGRR